VYQHTEKGLLKDKTVIMVTNQLQYVSAADKILMMDNGKIAAEGTYSSLMVAGTPFYKLMTEHGVVEDENHSHIPTHSAGAAAGIVTDQAVR